MVKKVLFDKTVRELLEYTYPFTIYALANNYFQELMCEGSDGPIQVRLYRVELGIMKLELLYNKPVSWSKYDAEIG